MISNTNSMEKPNFSLSASIIKEHSHLLHASLMEKESSIKPKKQALQTYNASLMTNPPIPIQLKKIHSKKWPKLLLLAQQETSS